MKTILCIVLAICGAPAFCGDEKPLEPIPDKTTVSATLDVPHQAGQNLIWCGTFQVAWNALGNDFCGEPLRLDGTPPIERSLNSASVSARDIDAESVIKAGKVVPEFLEALNAELKKRFGANAPPEVKVSSQDKGPKVLAYAFLFKNIAFKIPFDKQREPLLWDGIEKKGETLQAFGIMKVERKTPPDMTQQIKLLNDKYGEYIVELATTSEKDHLILAQIKPGATLQETLDAVRKKVSKPARAPFAIQLSDQCLIPCVQIALERVYSEIIGKKVLNEKLPGYTVSEARQNIRFQLDEKGATLKSEAHLEITKNGHNPRIIIFDQPFLLYLERTRATTPYLAIWFENPNLFVKGNAAEKPAARPTHEPELKK